MKYIGLFTLLALLLSFFPGSHAQTHLPYKFSRTLEGTMDSFYIDSLPRNLSSGKKNLIRQQGSKLIVLSQTKQGNNSKSFTVKKYDLDSYRTTNVWHCDIPDSIYFTDFCLLPDKSLLLLTNERLYLFDVVKNKLQKSIAHRSNLRKIDILNDKQYLLFDVYPFHPYDGISKVSLRIYDAAKEIITESQDIPLEGISLGNAINHWLRVINQNIYIVSPLTGKVAIYNSGLKEVNTFQLAIPEIDNKHNREFVAFMDREKAEADDELNKLRKEKGEVYIQTHEINSTYYNKEALRKRLDTFQQHYTYVEKLFAMNDSIMLVSVSRPEYGMMFRDLYFVNLKKKLITKVISKWRTFPPRKGAVEYMEDYFTIPLPMATMQEPFFYNGKAYASSEYPVTLFQAGGVKELDNTLFKWQKHNFSTWHVLEYTIQ